MLDTAGPPPNGDADESSDDGNSGSEHSSTTPPAPNASSGGFEAPSSSATVVSASRLLPPPPARFVIESTRQDGTRSRRLIPSVSDKIPAEMEAGELRLRLRLRPAGCAWMGDPRPPSQSADASQPIMPAERVGVGAGQYPATRADWPLLPRTRRDPARRCGRASRGRSPLGSSPTRLLVCRLSAAACDTHQQPLDAHVCLAVGPHSRQWHGHRHEQGSRSEAFSSRKFATSASVGRSIVRVVSAVSVDVPWQCLVALWPASTRPARMSVRGGHRIEALIALFTRSPSLSALFSSLLFSVGCPRCTSERHQQIHSFC